MPESTQPNKNTGQGFLNQMTETRDVSHGLLNLIGNTPLIRIGNIYAKFEGMNPSGSIKDRVALEIIEAAEREGEIEEGSTIVEASSGNTGISLAMVAAIKGYKMIVVMPENMSEERKQMMRAYNAELVLTSRSGSLTEAIEMAQRYRARYYLGRSHRLLAEVGLKTDFQRSPHHFEKAISIFQEIKAENELALAYSGMGRLHKQQGNNEQAREYLTKALDILERLGTLLEPDKVKQELAALPA